MLPNASRIFRLGELSLVEKQLSALLAYIGFFLIVATQVRRSEIRAYGRFVLILAVLTSLGVLYESRTGFNVFYDWTRLVLGPIAHVIPAPTNIHPSIDEGRKTVVGPTAARARARQHADRGDAVCRDSPVRGEADGRSGSSICSRSR